MARIHKLDPHMINMIAAGEVIERPASVVKELMENAIDAGATQVTVAVEDGGRKEIRVTDNGEGMSAEDLEVAFETHATSKIRTSQDLRAIGTLGFRGEALASIAAIAQVKAVTHQAGSPSAYCLEIDCGQRGAVTPGSGAEGTTITVRDLFYKLPARRKFLRTTQTEMGHISEQFIRIALGSLAVKDSGAVTPLDLNLRHHGRDIFRLAAGDDLRARVRSLFPMFNQAPDTAWVRAEQADKGLRVWGLLGHPDLARSNGTFQYVFLNGRFIRDKTVTHAIKEAYRGLLEPNRYPVVFLFLEMPLDDYDVNVHPTKTEVRFYNGNLVHSQVLACVREHLLGVDMQARGTLPGTGPASVPATLSSGRADVSDAMADFFKRQRARMDTPRASSPAATYASTAAPTIPHPDTDWPTPTVPLHPESAARRLLQIHDSYIVAETDEGFIVVDQHALHEKILYERMCTQVAAQGLTSQRLLIPQPVALNEVQAHRLNVHADLMKSLGIEVVPFGPRTYAIQAFPTLLEKADPVDMVQQLVDLLDENEGLEPDRILDAVLSMAACKAAIKAHHPLSRGEMEQLLRDGQEAESSSRCPHGRPATLRFTLRDLEKQFLRT